MRSHVARLLKQPVRTRKMVSVALDADQFEMVEKLSLFFTRELGHNFSKNQVIEEAVRAFADESTDYIFDEYDLDLRNTTLTDLQQYKRICTIDISALDTVVLPVRDDESCKKMLFEDRQWNPVQLDHEKLHHLKYAAFCFGNPTGAITHYARIRSYVPAAGDTRKKILHFDPPETIGERLEWREQGRSRLRRPRYTAFALLLEAKNIEELFGQ